MTEMMLKYHGCEAKKEEEEDNGFDCPECGKKYWSQKMLDIHKKVRYSLFKLKHYLKKYLDTSQIR